MGFHPDLGILRRPRLAAACLWLNGIFAPPTRICCSAFCRLVDGCDTSSRRAGRLMSLAAALSSVQHATEHEVSRSSSKTTTGRQTLEQLILFSAASSLGTVCEEVRKKVVGAVWIRARIEERWWELTWGLRGFYFSAIVSNTIITATTILINSN